MVFGLTKLFADDTPIPVLDPGRVRTKIGRLWVYARDDRPWIEADPPAAVYLYTRSQGRASCRSSAGLPWGTASNAGFERLTAPGVHHAKKLLQVGGHPRMRRPYFRSTTFLITSLDN